MSKATKETREVPTWAFAVVIGLVVVIAAYFILGRAGGGGPLPESQYPKEAYKPPTRPSYGTGGSPAGPGGPVGPQGGGGSSVPPQYANSAGSGGR